MSTNIFVMDFWYITLDSYVLSIYGVGWFTDSGSGLQLRIKTNASNWKGKGNSTLQIPLIFFFETTVNLCMSAFALSMIRQWLYFVSITSFYRLAIWIAGKGVDIIKTPRFEIQNSRLSSIKTVEKITFSRMFDFIISEWFFSFFLWSLCPCLFWSVS